MGCGNGGNSMWRAVGGVAGGSKGGLGSMESVKRLLRDYFKLN